MTNLTKVYCFKRLILRTFGADMSRRIFAIFFLMIYALVLLQPLVPFINYKVNKDFIAKNLCENRNKPGKHCNGKCYLAKEINKVSHGLPVSNAPNQKGSSIEEASVHLGGLFAFSFVNESNPQEFSVYTFCYRSSLYQDGVYRPPCA